MKKYQWTVPDTTGFDHQVSVQISAWSGKLHITIDGNEEIVRPQGTQNLLGLIDHPLTVGGKECRLVAVGTKADLVVDGQYLTGKRPYVPYQKLPKWAWVFIGLCLLICVNGGAISFAIGFFSAMQCGRTAVSPYAETKTKVLSCIGITVAAWVAIFILSFLIALLLA